MFTAIPLAPDLLERLERLAKARHTNQEHLLSEVIRAYLDREEAKFVPIALSSRRIPGGDEGRVFVAPDFNAPLPQEIEDSFYL